MFPHTPCKDISSLSDYELLCYPFLPDLLTYIHRFDKKCCSGFMSCSFLYM
ncbi:hypothetical protein MBAV_002549 [Candidatus Magnetobacterium bavaricum]|uniref:Uncharacterized protein n=1 Tax=Candidatus Magnetobacterium bavaricum TaxID=29290 RepID=A0A0F3GTR0_9BACT|nr:hypothetical protein MBAV_002549 [Candidatus Magnetobacterium bavaricum]